MACTSTDEHLYEPMHWFEIAADAMNNVTMFGNAARDGSQFHDWFVGNIQYWCNRDGLPFESGQFPLRNTTDIEMKWRVHRRGEIRPGGWAASSNKTSLTLLVRGRFSIRFRHPNHSDPHIEYELKEEGDYVMWRDGIEHFWQANEESVTLTVRW